VHSTFLIHEIAVILLLIAVFFKVGVFLFVAEVYRKINNPWCRLLFVISFCLALTFGLAYLDGDVGFPLTN